LAVVLNPAPVIVTLVPTGPMAGENEVITGCENNSWVEIQNNMAIIIEKLLI